MTLTDLIPLEKWKALETEIHERSGLEANVFGTDGVRITDSRFRVNRLCPAVKATDKGQAFICAVAHMNLANEAKNTAGPVVDACDAGLIKIVVPVIVDGAFIGAVGACGLLPEGEAVDAFLVNKITGIDEEKVAVLSGDIPALAADAAMAMAAFIRERVAAIIGSEAK